MSLNNGELKFNNNIVSDNSSKYWIYYTSTFNTTGATLIQDYSGNTLTDYVSGRTSIPFTFNYDTLLETGYTAVSIGLDKSQYAKSTGSFTNTNTNVINLNSDNELNYHALSGINWSYIYNTPTTLSEYGITNAYNITQVNTLLTGYTLVTNFDSHTADTSIHYTKNSIYLGDLANVSVTGVTDGFYLMYSAGTWIPQSVASASASITLDWKFNNSITNSNPGSKSFKFNSATLSAITYIYINNNTNNGIDGSLILSLINDGSSIFIQQQNDSTKAFLFQVSGNTIDNSGWYSVPVIYKDSISTIPSNNSVCSFVFFSKSSSVDLSNYTTLVSFNNFTGVTAPSLYTTISSFNNLTANTYTQTQVNNLLLGYYTSAQTYTSTQVNTLLTGYTSLSIYNTYTGVTAPSLYVSLSVYNIFTGVTAPSLYTTIVAFNNLTANTYSQSQVNNLLLEYYTTAQTYTSTQINTKLTGYTTTSSFNTYTGSTNRIVSIKVISDIDILTIGNSKVIFTVPIELNNYNLSNVGVSIITSGSTQPNVQVQITNLTTNNAMLSTQITIDSGQTTSYASNIQPVINPTYKKVSTGHELSIDVNAVGTNVKGLQINLTFNI